jgi:hypothetical protein
MVRGAAILSAGQAVLFVIRAGVVTLSPSHSVRLAIAVSVPLLALFASLLWGIWRRSQWARRLTLIVEGYYLLLSVTTAYRIKSAFASTDLSVLVIDALGIAVAALGLGVFVLLLLPPARQAFRRHPLNTPTAVSEPIAIGTTV